MSKITKPSVTSRDADHMSRSAKVFLSTLTNQQKSKAAIEFDSEERENWHYVPKPRHGMSLGEMNTTQLNSAQALIASGLSSKGYQQTKAIIGLEIILGEIERRRGVIRFDRDPDLYYLTVFGNPEDTRYWGWRFEGHHISLHFTVVNGEMISPTPFFFGANPSEVETGLHKGMRILKDEEDIARNLLLSLKPDQRRVAVIYPIAPADLITRASRRVEIGKPAGLPAHLMSLDQQEVLESLIRAYIERTTSDVAAQILRKMQSDKDNVHFAWAGSEHRGQGHYYRIHGPNLFVEYDNTQNNAHHIHSVWRDVTEDFAVDTLQDHYLHHHT